MIKNYSNIVAIELGIKEKQVDAVIALIEEGGTVPFIARYRKEATGSLDEVAIANIRDRVEQLKELDKRREAILKSIDEQGKLTPELSAKINEAQTMSVLEDIYLPYKPKRKTRASMAREKGLEPLADIILLQKSIDLTREAVHYVDAEKGVANVEEALQGARDIIAEKINEDAEIRAKVRKIFMSDGIIKSRVIKGKETEAVKYKDYFEWEESISKVASHRLLAMRRGEKEMFLSLDIAPNEEDIFLVIENEYLLGSNACSEQVEIAIKDAYKRLLKPSIETEVRIETKKMADLEAIGVFKDNLKQLLLSAPLGAKNVLALDPGFRTGCKLVCLDRQGKLLHYETIFPNEPQKNTRQSAAVLLAMCEKYQIEAISIGNGTAARETESFVKSVGLPKEILVVMVNESGASIYSASDTAREEFPELDLTVRGSVSIGRRLMDPLAELVKIDPKSIGVGQYQHDVDQHALKQGLDDVVVSCVNKVGVEVNTASKELLSYVSGLGSALAKNIVEYRNANGPFSSREALKKVPRLGDKVFEQAAGFLRIKNAKNPLDNSGVHPETYKIVEAMSRDIDASIEALIAEKDLRKSVKLEKYISDTIGLPTLKDIMDELEKPGRDPRERFEVLEFDDNVHTMEDLKVGMVLNGLVTNVTNFGAFVDIGVHQDGLVHKSHLADRFVENPADFVKVQQKVKVTVLEVDIPRKRISLSMKSDPFGEKPKASKQEKREKKEQRAQKASEGTMEDKLAELRNRFK
ncbi:MAG: RNA-binding transcriptional accessory protein [Cyclobacteriaceae bacterium]|nr:RNA-binding transcriptional accessory protein [Cyclobacteriaceae bacterium]